MNDNVIIFGAGSSYDAGIPLSSGFVEKMREYAFKGESEAGPLSDSDKEVFENAMGVWRKLYNYHGSAEFDDRNIEDILSILSFNIIGGTHAEKDSLNWMIKAIARTIELSCNVKHNGSLDKPQDAGDWIYRGFWGALFERFNDSSNIPTIVTFNYDLVLERALFQELISINKKHYPFDGFILRYHYKYLEDFCYQIVKTQYLNRNDLLAENEVGTKLKRCNGTDLKKPIVVEILKLHGSLNFPKKTGNEKPEYQPPTNLLSEPFIIPPISNKLISDDAEEIWKVAINSLRGAKNIVIVGYSLPRTDIYVQYFLKTALGPNMDLMKITIFNPELFEDRDLNSDMRKRYSTCFSAQVIQRLINFNPEQIGSTEKIGSFKHFVYDIPNTKERLFF
jgi:hypothetical protein